MRTMEGPADQPLQGQLQSLAQKEAKQVLQPTQSASTFPETGNLGDSILLKAYLVSDTQAYPEN